MYPEINKFCKLLHERGISSFLVTNAQFPEAIERLVPVTQLYISCDAATKEDLRAVDRPIFEDFWERFMACIDHLARKPQRTVFRLTLVAKMNMHGVEQYAALVRRGQPDLVVSVGCFFFCAMSASTRFSLFVGVGCLVSLFDVCRCCLFGVWINTLFVVCGC